MSEESKYEEWYDPVQKPNFPLPPAVKLVSKDACYV